MRNVHELGALDFKHHMRSPEWIYSEHTTTLLLPINSDIGMREKLSVSSVRSCSETQVRGISRQK